jgi:Lon protease-like protein
MVLPRSVLFPHAMLPLYIFEERYRKMLKSILTGNRVFGIGTIRRANDGNEEDEREGFYDVLCIGVVRVAIDHEDGTSELLLQGICRAKILELVKKRPYCRARIEPLESKGDQTVMTDALTAKIAELAKERSQFNSKISETTVKMITSVSDPGTMSDLVSYTFLDNWHDKQVILETLDLTNRLKKLITMLQHEIERLQILEKLKKQIDDDDHTKLN